MLSGLFLPLLAAFFPVRWAMAAMGSTVGLDGPTIRLDDWTFQGTVLSKHSQLDATFHLLLSWFFLVLTILVLGVCIANFLKKKDVRG